MQQHEREAAGSGTWEVVAAAGGGGRMKQRRRKKAADDDETEELGEEDEDNMNEGGGGISERQREHPFIVTEPGEVARGKKNGLDYLFHLYDQCRDFLIQVQIIAKERGEKCPTKVNDVHKYMCFLLLPWIMVMIYPLLFTICVFQIQVILSKYIFFYCLKLINGVEYARFSFCL